MLQGYDTTTSTIAFCLYNLSQNSLVQVKYKLVLPKTINTNLVLPNSNSVKDINKKKSLIVIINLYNLVIKSKLHLIPSHTMIHNKKKIKRISYEQSRDLLFPQKNPGMFLPVHLTKAASDTAYGTVNFLLS